MYHKGFGDVARYLFLLEYLNTQLLTSDSFQAKFDRITRQVVSSLKEFIGIKQFGFFQAFYRQ